MDDLLYFGVSAVLLVLTWGLLKLCELLQSEADRHVEGKSGGKA